MSNDNVSNLLEEYKEFGLQFRYYAAEISTTNRLMLPPLTIGLLVLYGKVEKFVGVELNNPEAVHLLVWFGCLIISLMWVFNVSRLAQMMHVVLNHLKKRESELIKEDITIAKMDEKMEKKMRVSKMLRHHILRVIGFWIYFTLLLLFMLKFMDFNPALTLLEFIVSGEILITLIAIVGSGVLAIFIWLFYFKMPFSPPKETPAKLRDIKKLLQKIGVKKLILQYIIPIIILLGLIGLLSLFLINLQAQPDAHAHITCGLKYYEKGQYAEAIEEYTKAIEIKPDYAKAYALRGEAHRANGEDDKSNKDWSMVKALRGGQ